MSRWTTQLGSRIALRYGSAADVPTLLPYMSPSQ